MYIFFLCPELLLYFFRRGIHYSLTMTKEIRPTTWEFTMFQNYAYCIMQIRVHFITASTEFFQKVSSFLITAKKSFTIWWPRPWKFLGCGHKIFKRFYSLLLREWIKLNIKNKARQSMRLKQRIMRIFYVLKRGLIFPFIL